MIYLYYQKEIEKAVTDTDQSIRPPFHATLDKQAYNHSNTFLFAFQVQSHTNFHFEVENYQVSNSISNEISNWPLT